MAGSVTSPKEIVAEASAGRRHYDAGSNGGGGHPLDRRNGGCVLSLWTALPLQADFDLICVASCKHLSGVARRSRAPKWGIRSHTPLQLVGHEDLDNSQALCAPVRPVQLISPSSRKLWRAFRQRRGRASPVLKHGPDNPCVLIGDRHRCAVETAPLSKLVDPLICGIAYSSDRFASNGTRR